MIYLGQDENNKERNDSIVFATIAIHHYASPYPDYEKIGPFLREKLERTYIWSKCDKWYVFYSIMLKCLAILWQPCNKWNHKLPYIKQNEVLFWLETFFLEEEDVISAAGSKAVEKSGEKEVD